MDATIGINPVVARSENKLLSFRNTEEKKNYLSQEMWIFLPQRMQHFCRRVLLYRNFLICGILTAGEIIFVLKRQTHDFYQRNQFRSES
jgi:hypothetical protein